MSKSTPMNLSGSVFDRLTVIELSHWRRTPCGKKKFMWKCVCQCGKSKIVDGQCLRSGNTQSCGCLAKEINAIKNTFHGMAKRDARHEFYQTWSNIRARCERPTATGYKWYGARGIKVCERWKSFHSFHEDMFSGWRKGLSIDRINNDGDYSPDNCRWVTWDVQVKNKRKRGTA